MPELLLVTAVFTAFPATGALALAWHLLRRNPPIYAASDMIYYGSAVFTLACGLALWLG